MASKKNASVLKPSGYDVVIRNRNAIQRINRRFKKARGAEEKKLIDEKDRLLHEMWKACPHDVVIEGIAALRTPTGPIPMPMRFCTSCGECDEPRTDGAYKLLKPRRGRAITELDEASFSARLHKTLLWTGYNIKNG